MARTGILIVTHNSAGHIGACLDAVSAVRGAQDVVLIIDNASTDLTADVVAAAKPPVRFLRNSRNAGFAGAVNQGFRLLIGETDAVLLLNPDVILTTSLTDLSEACQTAGLAAGRLTDSDGKTQIGFSFRRFPTPIALFLETIGVNRLWPANPVNQSYRCLGVDHGLNARVEQPAGAMLMIRNDVWLSLQGFDEQFHPVWFEDVDFCRRAALEGFHAAYLHSFEGIHEGGHSVLRIPDCNRRWYWYASLLRYSRKHFGRNGRSLIAGGVVAASLARSMVAMLRLHGRSFEEARMYWTIARTSFMYPVAEPVETEWKEVPAESAANVRSRVLNEGLPSTENTERTLKRLHAR